MVLIIKVGNSVRFKWVKSSYVHQSLGYFTLIELVAKTQFIKRFFMSQKMTNYARNAIRGFKISISSIDAYHRFHQET